VHVAGQPIRPPIRQQLRPAGRARQHQTPRSLDCALHPRLRAPARLRPRRAPAAGSGCPVRRAADRRTGNRRWAVAAR
jgi:hypothetical protein